jgi:hypothetical protein
MLAPPVVTATTPAAVLPTDEELIIARETRKALGEEET